MNSGIYRIRNIINEKCYIGSSCNLKKRKTRHFSELKANRHHNLHLQRAFVKYGETNFVFEIIELCESEQLFELEQKHIDQLNPKYNIGSVDGGDNISKHPENQVFRELQSKLVTERYANMTPEEKQKRSENVRGSNNANWRGGKTFFTCPICKIEKRVTGEKQQKSCNNCRDKTGNLNPFYGKRHSEETKQKLRQNKLGAKPTNSKKIKIDGVLYSSFADAAKALNVSHGLISYRVKKSYPNYEVIQ